MELGEGAVGGELRPVALEVVEHAEGGGADLDAFPGRAGEVRQRGQPLGQLAGDGEPRAALEPDDAAPLAQGLEQEHKLHPLAVELHLAVQPEPVVAVLDLHAQLAAREDSRPDPLALAVLAVAPALVAERGHLHVARTDLPQVEGEPDSGWG